MAEAGEEAVDDEQLLLATATGSPQTVQTMRWLMPSDFTVPQYGALWRCITGLVHRGGSVDPVTVLGEAQQAGLLTGTVTTRNLLELLSTPMVCPTTGARRSCAAPCSTALAPSPTASSSSPTTRPPLPTN